MPPKRKAVIPKALKISVWNKHIGEEIGKNKCLCCDITDITQAKFHCGHIVAEANGGEMNINNMVPICESCNKSMGTKNLNDFRDMIQDKSVKQIKKITQKDKQIKKTSKQLWNIVEKNIMNYFDLLNNGLKINKYFTTKYFSDLIICSYFKETENKCLNCDKVIDLKHSGNMSIIVDKNGKPYKYECDFTTIFQHLKCLIKCHKFLNFLEEYEKYVNKETCDYNKYIKVDFGFNQYFMQLDKETTIIQSKLVI
jgi:hypothetical protein